MRLGVAERFKRRAARARAMAAQRYSAAEMRAEARRPAAEGPIRAALESAKQEALHRAREEPAAGKLRRAEEKPPRAVNRAEEPQAQAAGWSVTVSSKRTRWERQGAVRPLEAASDPTPMFGCVTPPSPLSKLSKRLVVKDFRLGSSVSVARRRSSSRPFVRDELDRGCPCAALS